MGRPCKASAAEIGGELRAALGDGSLQRSEQRAVGSGKSHASRHSRGVDLRWRRGGGTAGLRRRMALLRRGGRGATAVRVWAAGWEDEGAGVPRGPIKGRAGILGRRAVEGAGERHGEISGGLLCERVAGKTELTSGPGWSVGETAARVTG